jgi:hypothetical protein
LQDEQDYCDVVTAKEAREMAKQAPKKVSPPPLPSKPSHVGKLTAKFDAKKGVVTNNLTSTKKT